MQLMGYQVTGLKLEDKCWLPDSKSRNPVSKVSRAWIRTLTMLSFHGTSNPQPNFDRDMQNIYLYLYVF